MLKGGLSVSNTYSERRNLRKYTRVARVQDGLVYGLIKRREVMNGARKIRREKLRERQYMEGYTRCLESKRVDWGVGGNVEQM